MPTQTCQSMAKGYCKITEVRTEGDTAIIVFQTPDCPPNQRTTWRLHKIKKRSNFNGKLKRACMKIAKLQDHYKIKDGQVGIGGDQMSTLTIEFYSGTINRVLIKVLSILHEEIE